MYVQICLNGNFLNWVSILDISLNTPCIFPGHPEIGFWHFWFGLSRWVGETIQSGTPLYGWMSRVFFSLGMATIAWRIVSSFAFSIYIHSLNQEQGRQTSSFRHCATATSGPKYTSQVYSIHMNNIESYIWSMMLYTSSVNVVYQNTYYTLMEQIQNIEPTLSWCFN